MISKVLQIDSDLEQRELEFAVYQAFSHQSPFPVEELSLDFVKVTEKASPAAARRPSKCMPPKDVVDSRLHAVKKRVLNQC